METKDNINYTADNGKVFIRESDRCIVGHSIGLGASDNIGNYIEIDCPLEYKGLEGYDNTINLF